MPTKPGDDRALVGDVGDQALRFEQLEGFAHRDVADAEAPGEVVLAQLLALLVRVRHDERAQGVGHLGGY